MTPEAQRIAIAESLGWERVPVPFTVGKNTVDWIVLEKEGQRASVFTGTIPDYLNDLSAMLEAESALSNLDHQKLCLFLHKSIMGTLDNFDVNGNCNLECVSRVVKATATQRAEAFLRALGKWDDTL